jgi:hypothetical protein
MASCPSSGINNCKVGCGTTTSETGNKDPGSVSQKKTNADNSCLTSKISENANPPKKVMLRIKMASDTSERKKNPTVYSDFGLSNTSSGSDDEDEDDDDGTERGDQRSDSDVDSSPDRTPLTMIRVTMNCIT